MRSIWKQIILWYEGEITVYDDSCATNVSVIGFNVRRHWTALVARVLVELYLRNWQWLIGTAIAVGSLWLSILTLGAK
jgi:hypothetical protein